MQTVWKGAISFGLVSIPIRLFTATEERGVSLHQVHAADGGRIRYRRVCQVDGEEVAYSDIAKGYELPDGEVVVLTDEDFAQLPLATSRAIDVLSFVEADTIDPVQLSRSYYADPTGADPKPYILLRDALERTGKVAVVKVALRQRESLAMLRPRDGVLVLQLMLWPDEVRKPEFSFLGEEVRLRPQEVQMAESYVETLTGEIEAEELVDRYRVALEQLVEAKAAGREVEQPPAPAEDTGAAIDLMEALRRSVEAAKRSRGAGGEGGAAAKPARKRAVPESAAVEPSATSSAAPKKAAGKRASAEEAPAKKAPAKKAAAKKAAAKKTSEPARKQAAAKQGTRSRGRQSA
jgi:DNA end-binding protein Ku